jgi:aspartyl-tRNA(Asn)/glutamyl-tRNA(Gln) amidotransferase subunit B
LAADPSPTSNPGSPWEAVIGLECHAQLRTRSKMFCRCPVLSERDEENGPGELSNTAVCPICLGHPGTLPVLNQGAVALAVRAALALGAEVHAESQFARKHYFYPDLPKGYQISQHERPLATGGALHLRVDGELRPFRLTRLHVEEDAGRMRHVDGGPSIVDWNRAGVPLLEIVGEPDLRSPEQAELWLRTLHRVLVESGVCAGDMEKGQLRCDVNVSVHRVGEPWGPRIEVKNVNSFRFLARALRFEIDRQIGLLERGETLRPETRNWVLRETLLLRRKEGASDYRYLPEPDLPLLRVSEAEIEAQRAHLPGVPLNLHLLRLEDQERASWSDRFGLDARAVEALRADPVISAFFLDSVASGGEARAMANRVLNELLRKSRLARPDEPPLSGARIRPPQLVEIQDLLDRGCLSAAEARRLVDVLYDEGGEVSVLVARLGLGQRDDLESLRVLVRDLVAGSPVQRAKYLAGNRNMLGYFMGRVMGSGLRVDPGQARAMIEAALSGTTLP